MCALDIQNVYIWLTKLVNVIFNKQRAVHGDEGVDSLSYSRQKAASIVVHRTLNGILDEP